MPRPCWIRSPVPGSCGSGTMPSKADGGRRCSGTTIRLCWSWAAAKATTPSPWRSGTRRSIISAWISKAPGSGKGPSMLLRTLSPTWLSCAPASSSSTLSSARGRSLRSGSLSRTRSCAAARTPASALRFSWSATGNSFAPAASCTSRQTPVISMNTPRRSAKSMTSRCLPVEQTFITIRSMRPQR